MWHLWTVTNSNPICGRSAIPFPYCMVNYCLENYKKIIELASQKKDTPPNPKYKKDTPPTPKYLILLGTKPVTNSKINSNHFTGHIQTRKNLWNCGHGCVLPFHDGVYLKRIESMTQQCRQKIHLCEGGMFKKSRNQHLKIFAHPYRRPL